MQDNNVEQAEKSASKIGKFNTAEDLLAAYNALESEFTKRCQLIKRLQAELNSVRAQAESDDVTQVGAVQDGDGSIAPDKENRPVHEAEVGDNDEKTEKPAVAAAPNVARSEPSAITADDVLNEILQNACEYAEVLCTIPEIMSACIASYKQRLIQPHPATAPKGCAVIVPAKRPTTLSEAKRLADALLAGN